MKRHRLNSREWSLNAKDPLAVPNARIALSLLRSIRRLPGTFPAHSFDDLGRLMAPVIELDEDELRTAVTTMRRLEARSSSQYLAVDGEVESLLDDRCVLSMVGDGLARGLPQFRGLGDKLEARLADFTATHQHPADQNVEMLADLVGLAPLESRYVRLAAAFCYGSVDRSLFAFANSQSKAIKAAEAFCQVRGADTQRLFDVDRPLAMSGLFDALREHRSSRDLDDLLRLSALGERLLSAPFREPAQMSAVVLTRFAPPALTDALQWPHLTQQQAVLRAALGSAVEQNVKGFNVLLYGAPGTGKTEFARQLIADIDGNGFSVVGMDDVGNEATREERLASLRMCQTFASRQLRTVLVLDEAEDVFQGDHKHPFARVFKRGGESKAWINSLLESNAHPVIWISNAIGHIDPAYLRRFTYCLEFPCTPFSERHKIATLTLARVGCTAALIDTISRNASLAPSALVGAAGLAKLCASSGIGADIVVRVALDGHLKACGHDRQAEAPRLKTRFDTRYLNVQGHATPERVLTALAGGKPAALMFSGPPGTGKTQFAGELAKRLGRQLVVKTASDICTKWYGESERNVARMFLDCDPQTELLFLDEAEVVLGERTAGNHRADTAVTAEFLRWLEVFEGVFVCATNYGARLDAALMRRFLFRLEFKPLNAQQRQAMFCELALDWQPDRHVVLPPLDASTLSRLAALDRLTPGDFANAARRIAALGLAGSNQQWIEELEEEQRAKAPGAGRRVGFV